MRLRCPRRAEPAPGRVLEVPRPGAVASPQAPSGPPRRRLV